VRLSILSLSPWSTLPKFPLQLPVPTNLVMFRQHGHSICGMTWNRTMSGSSKKRMNWTRKNAVKLEWNRWWRRSKWGHNHPANREGYRFCCKLQSPSRTFGGYNWQFWDVKLKIGPSVFLP
jgi:hypothetical protein